MSLPVLHGEGVTLRPITEPDLDALVAIIQSPGVREYASRRAQRATVQLSYGSRVILVPESRLRVSEPRTDDSPVEQ